MMNCEENKMREILFRGQTRRYGEKVHVPTGEKVPGNWVYGGIFQGGGSKSIIYGGDPVEKYVVYSDTVGQFTGLVDKNGVKIFEGDILKSEYGAIFIVSWIKTSAMFMLVDTLCDPCMDISCCDEFKIIGNVHDNPELTKQ